ncbi:ribosome modulation factor [Mycetohabitans sp. B8]|uniref:ribosome modulation factor n=1 Tax=Mycetohabitans sp. B8 TaxID=2841845 RepID=UPI001F2F6B5F|nr:ribosome modulation factor [Mycetohabitans sp. B8]
MNHPNDEVSTILNMTAETVGRDLLQALVQEIKLLPNVWVKLPQNKQDDVIARLRKRVEANVKMAVHLITAHGRVVLQGDLEKVTIHNGTQAMVKFSKAAPGLLELAAAQGQAVLLVVGADACAFTAAMDEVRGESDQRSIDLGHEYDPHSDGKGMNGDDDKVIDAEMTAITHQPLNAELAQAHADGYKTASEGKPQSDCPTMKGELCIEWVKGWKAWHKENNTEWWQEYRGDELGGEAA